MDKFIILCDGNGNLYFWFSKTCMRTALTSYVCRSQLRIIPHNWLAIEFLYRLCRQGLHQVTCVRVPHIVDELAQAYIYNSSIWHVCHSNIHSNASQLLCLFSMDSLTQVIRLYLIRRHLKSPHRIHQFDSRFYFCLLSVFSRKLECCLPVEQFIYTQLYVGYNFYVYNLTIQGLNWIEVRSGSASRIRNILVMLQKFLTVYQSSRWQNLRETAFTHGRCFELTTDSSGSFRQHSNRVKFQLTTIDRRQWFPVFQQ